MAKKLSPDYRGRVAEKIMEWGNLVFVGLVIAQALAKQRDYLMALVGLLLLLMAYAVAHKIMKGGGK